MSTLNTVPPSVQSEALLSFRLRFLFHLDRVHKDGQNTVKLDRLAEFVERVAVEVGEAFVESANVK